MQKVIMQGKAITQVKGHELKRYEALEAIAGPFVKFTIVMMKGPNKTIKLLEKKLINRTLYCPRLIRWP